MTYSALNILTNDASSHCRPSMSLNSYNVTSSISEYSFEYKHTSTVASRHEHPHRSHHPQTLPQPWAESFQLFPLLPLRLQQIIWAIYLSRHPKWARTYIRSSWIWAHGSRTLDWCINIPIDYEARPRLWKSISVVAGHLLNITSICCCA